MARLSGKMRLQQGLMIGGMGVRGSFCTATILSSECPLCVNNGLCRIATLAAGSHHSADISGMGGLSRSLAEIAGAIIGLA
jgi:hypothetical protein